MQHQLSAPIYSFSSSDAATIFHHARATRPCSTRPPSCRPCPQTCPALKQPSGHQARLVSTAAAPRLRGAARVRPSDGGSARRRISRATADQPRDGGSAERRRISRATAVTSAAARARPSARPGLGKAPQHAPGATARSRARGAAQTGGQPAAALQGRRAGTRRGGAGLKRPAESWSMRRRRATWSVTAMRKHARHANSPCPAHHTRQTSPPA